MDEVHSGFQRHVAMRPPPSTLASGQAQVAESDRSQMAYHAKTERFTQVKANQILTIREGSGIVRQVQAQKQSNWLVKSRGRVAGYYQGSLRDG